MAAGNTELEGQRPPATPLVVDLARAAQMLSVSIKAVRSLIRRGELRALKIGRVWRVRIREIDDFLRRQERGACQVSCSPRAGMPIEGTEGAVRPPCSCGIPPSHGRDVRSGEPGSKSRRNRHFRLILQGARRPLLLYSKPPLLARRLGEAASPRQRPDSENATRLTRARRREEAASALDLWPTIG